MLLFGLLIYVLAQFAIGLWVSRRVSSDTDYILAGRSLGTTLVAFSVFATWFGAEAIVATAGAVYDGGLSGAIVDPFAYAAALLISGMLLAGVLWGQGYTTFADLFRRRYSAHVETLVVLVLLPGSILWAAAQIRAFGQILSAGSGLSVVTAISLAAVLVAAYTTVGGLLADAVTDFLQGMVVIVGLVVLVLIVAARAGGFGAAIAGLEPEHLSFLAASEDGPWKKVESIVIAICGSLVAVELISRYLGARSADVARNGTVIGGVMYLALGMVPIFLGLAAASLAARDPAFKAAVPDSEQVVAALAQYYLPSWHYVLFAGAMVSAILSVVHAALHAPAAQVAHNLLPRVMPGLDDKQRLMSVRLCVLALSIVAFGLALASDKIKQLVEYASAFGSAGVFVTAMFALFTRIGGANSAIASIVAGVGVWAAGRFALDLATPYILALGTATAAYIAVAWWEGKTVATATT